MLLTTKHRGRFLERVLIPDLYVNKFARAEKHVRFSPFVYAKDIFVNLE